MKNLEKQTRIEMAEKFFNLLFGNVTERKFGYLWTKQGETKTTYPFTVSNPDERREMARKAIELSDAGADVYYGINLGDEPPKGNNRFVKEQVTMQTATVTDIDVLGGKHADPNKYPPSFDAAKSFLPFDVSLLVDSGYGMHGLCLYTEPITITADNRDDCEERNKKFLDVIRRRAGIYAKAVDGVGDLPRVLRVPGTFNYKLGRDNAPLCKLVDASTIRFTPADFDERLNALTPARTKSKQEAPPQMKTKIVPLNPADKPSEQERALAMLRFVPAAALTYEDWIATGMILKNNGNYLSDWEQWSRADERFKEGECEKKWASFKDNGGLNLGTLHEMASKLYGYSEKAFQRDWYAMHNPNPRIIHRPPDAEELAARLAELKAQPQSKSRDAKIIAATRDLCTWNYKKNEMGQVVKTSIKSVIKNMDLIFEHDPNLICLFGKDTFQDEVVFLKKAPWHEDDRTGDKWRDSDEAELRNYLRKNYAELKERQLIEDYVIHYANRNSFNAVKKFYESLPTWDRTPRAETLFVKFLGAEDTPYTREVTMKWLLGAIARIYHAGCDFQWAPVLQGAQRIGKSKLVKMLGGKEGVNPNGYSWHVALKDSVDDAHAVDALQKGGIIEIEEFSAARRAEINALKSFISADEDTRRFAYDRHATTRKRHGVFIVTCNDDQFLRDPTGNARFWIVKCTQEKFKRVDGMTPEYIRQIWAEVYQKYQELFKDGFDESKLKPSLELEIRAEEIAEAYLQDDGMTTEIKAFLEKKLPPAIIWRLMNKDDRRKYFVDGQITFDQTTLNFRRRAQGGREQDIERDINEIYKLCNAQRTDIQQITTADNRTLYRFYGSELREHICAAEIFNECFGTGDKRKLMYRFNEILNTLDGWHLGARLQKADPEYREQRKPYYRNTFHDSAQ